MDVHNITFRAIAHATESEDRVITALSHFLFGGEIETTKTEGHFGNPIFIMYGCIKGRDCTSFFGILKTKLSEKEIQKLKNELCERIDDECILHIRFDKQAAYKGTVQLARTSDAITADIKLKAYPARREKAIEVAEKNFFL